MKIYIKFFLLFILISMGLGVSSDFVLAGCKTYTYTYNIYKCSGGCGDAKIIKETWVGWECCRCTEHGICPKIPDRYPYLSSEVIVSVAEPWQVCVGGSYYERPKSKCGSSSTSGTKPYFVCSGNCLDNVSGLRYYSNPNYPKNPELTIDGSEDYPQTCSENITSNCIEPSNDSTNVKSPLKIDWDENAYWQKSGSCGNFGCPEGITAIGPQSYKLSLKVSEEVDNKVVNLVNPPTKADSETFSDYISKNFDQDTNEIKEGYFYKVLNTDSQPNYIDKGTYRSSEYNFRVDHNPCWLKSGQEYDLTIQTCCKADGTECNSGSNFKFTTAYAPELKSPEDLDWEGSNYSAWNAWPQIDSIDKLPLNNADYEPFDWALQAPTSGLKVTPPVLLDWCDVDSGRLEKRGTNSYSILPKIFETNPETNETKKVCAFNKGITDELCYHISNPVTLNLFSEYSDIDNYMFIKNSRHSWKVRGCPTVMAGICSTRPYSQEWYFETSDADLGESTNIVPADGSFVGLPVNISWVNPYGYVSSIFEFYKNGALIETKELSASGISYNDLDLKTTYSWRFKNCTDRYYKNCDDWSQLYKFTITGNPPELISPSGEVIPPLNFKWNSVPGARSYIFKLEGGGINKEIKIRWDNLKLEYSEDLPFKVNTDYNWQVKTCADIEGNKCGDYSNTLSFKVKLDAPTGLEPENKTLSLYEDRGSNLKWGEVNQIKTYQISFDYTKGEEETSKFCESLDKKENIINSNEYFFSPQCLGTYTWKVRSCFSDKCDDGTFSEWSESKNFTIFQNINPETREKVSETNNNTKSIVPCGRPLDDPETPWNERESCTISHLLIILRNIIDFALGRLVPLIIAGSVVYSGIKFFTALGNPKVIVQIKDLWKYIGLGLLIIIFSITAIDFVLTFVGYNVGVFGNFLK
ncbi:MAG TPA: hypothetical protein PKU93_02205 [Candidatus Pacearchaeota archaeon]|nr:hypothetical protein [Candidatus Pacearchaeota archaeon]